MDAINSFIGWLFGDKTGVLFLVLGGILLFLVISFVLERKTKKKQKSPVKGLFKCKWCGRRDLNPHELAFIRT